jgi:transcriptional regulator with XRE-family HTH domain
MFVAPKWVVMKTDVQQQLRAFGGNLRRLRTEQNITQEKLAELADLNIRTIQKIEAGQTNILITTAARIQQALACNWNKLMDL